MLGKDPGVECLAECCLDRTQEYSSELPKTDGFKTVCSRGEGVLNRFLLVHEPQAESARSEAGDRAMSEQLQSPAGGWRVFLM
jgi:hypothetical protein